MIKTILLNENLPFPHISFSLFLNCIIISIPILFNDVLYAYLAANVGLVFPWQYVTSMFAHGPEPPLLIHLFINLLIIIFCVSGTERLIGTWRTFFILVMISFILVFIRIETHNFYNGISSFVFVFVPFFLFLVFKEFKINRKFIWKDFYSLLSFLSLLIAILFYPLYFTLINSIICERNILHLISILIGVVFFIIWKKGFMNTFTEIYQIKVQKTKLNIPDKVSLIIGYSISMVNLLIVVIVLIKFD